MADVAPLTPFGLDVLLGRIAHEWETRRRIFDLPSARFWSKRDDVEDPMILAQIGDVVQKEFRIVEFKYQTVVLGYTDEEFAGQTTELEFKKKR